MKQTAVEWLVEQFDLTSESLIIKNVIEQAKEMEKQQKIDAYRAGKVNGFDSQVVENFTNVTAEQYYNETYGGNK